MFESNNDNNNCIHNDNINNIKNNNNNNNNNLIIVGTSYENCFQHMSWQTIQKSKKCNIIEI